MAKFPNIGYISNVTLTEYTPQYFTESLSLITKTRDRGIHQFQGELTFTVVGDSNKKALRAFLLQTKGRGVPIQIQFPGSMFTNTTITVSPQTNQAYTAGTTTIDLKGYSGVIQLGDVFTILNDDKVYTVVGVNGGGVGPNETIDIYPPLRRDQTDSTPLDFVDVTLNVNLISDTQTVSHMEGGEIHEITFSWKEAL